MVKWVLSVLTVLALVGVAAFFALRSDTVPKASDLDYTQQKAAVYRTAQTAVAQSLRSPGSAKFQPIEEALFLHEADGTWTIEAWVDSQNGFGALIRNKFTVRVKGSGATLEASDLQFADWP